MRRQEEQAEVFSQWKSVEVSGSQWKSVEVSGSLPCFPLHSEREALCDGFPCLDGSQEPRMKPLSFVFCALAIETRGAFCVEVKSSCLTVNLGHDNIARVPCYQFVLSASASLKY